MSEPTVEILLVEDNPADARLTMEVFRDSARLHQMRRVESGAEALAFLRREGPYGEAPRPDLILLDLGLPDKTGREVLAEVKADQRLSLIPVVVLSQSDSRADIEAAYELRANCYVTKPIDLESFRRVVKGIEEFWLWTVNLPQG